MPLGVGQYSAKVSITVSRMPLVFGPMRWTFLDVVRRVLNKDAHHMFAFRGHIGIEQARENDVQKWLLGKVTILGVVVRTPEVVGVWRNRNVATHMKPVPGRALKSGNRSKDKFTFPELPRSL